VTIVQQMLCRKEFAIWAARHRLPIKRYPKYGERVFQIFKTNWSQK
jgi:hypothetical protein